MSSIMRVFAAGAAACLLGMTATVSADDSGAYVEGADNTPSAESMTADLFIVRPLSIAATAIGTGIFLVGLPIELLTGDVSGPARRLVGEPARFTFTRPLGELR